VLRKKPPEIISVEELVKILVPGIGPFTAENAPRRAKVFERDHDAAHGEIAEDNVITQAEESDQINDPVPLPVFGYACPEGPAHSRILHRCGHEATSRNVTTFMRVFLRKTSAKNHSAHLLLVIILLVF
jgi:hypothetical protein